MTPYLDGDSFTYAFVDLRGYGGCRHVPGEYTVEEIAADCLAVADRLGWPRFSVVGHSMTGMVVQRLAADAAERIVAAVAVSPMSAAGSSASDEGLAFFARTIEDDEAFRRLACYVGGGLSRGWGEAKLRENRDGVSREAQRGYLRLFRSNFVEDVRHLATPFLVVIGDKDPGIDKAAMRATFLAWYPQAELRVIPNCGHYPMQECPPYFAMVLEAYLRQQADGVPPQVQAG